MMMPAIAPPLVSQQLSALSAEHISPDQQSVSVASAPQEPVYASQLPDGQHVADESPEAAAVLQICQPVEKTLLSEVQEICSSAPRYISVYPDDCVSRPEYAPIPRRRMLSV